MSWISESTPYGYSVFVVWRTIHFLGKASTRKGRVVVDIRGLNKITESDSYPMSLQADITALI